MTTWPPLNATDGGEAILSAFCERCGITDELQPKTRRLVLQELQKGYKSFLDEAIEFNASFEGIDLKPGALVRPASLPAQAAPSSAATVIPYEEAIQISMNLRMQAFAANAKFHDAS